MPRTSSSFLRRWPFPHPHHLALKSPIIFIRYPVLLNISSISNNLQRCFNDDYDFKNIQYSSHQWCIYIPGINGNQSQSRNCKIQFPWLKQERLNNLLWSSQVRALVHISWKRNAERKCLIPKPKFWITHHENQEIFLSSKMKINVLVYNSLILK